MSRPFNSKEVYEKYVRLPIAYVYVCKKCNVLSDSLSRRNKLVRAGEINNFLGKAVMLLSADWLISTPSFYFTCHWTTRKTMLLQVNMATESTTHLFVIIPIFRLLDQRFSKIPVIPVTFFFFFCGGIVN